MDNLRNSSSVGRAWEEAFHKAPQTYNTAEGLPFLLKFMRSPFVQLPRRYAHLKPGGRVLEGGCASGKFSVCYAMLGCDVFSLDFSSSMLENTRRLSCVGEEVSTATHISLLQGDLEHLPLRDNSFDLVFNEGVVEHWLDQQERRAVLAAMARAAKPGGSVAIIVPNGRHPLATYWIESSPAFLSAPPMVRYGADLVRDDLSAAGLMDISIDGIYAWRTIGQWPTNKMLILLGGLLQRAIPLPRGLRLKWGIHLIGMGRKP